MSRVPVVSFVMMTDWQAAKGFEGKKSNGE